MLWSPEKLGRELRQTAPESANMRELLVLGYWLHEANTFPKPLQLQQIYVTMFQFPCVLGTFWICLAAKFLSTWRAWHSRESLTSHQWDGWDDAPILFIYSLFMFVSRGLGPFSLKSACKKKLWRPHHCCFPQLWKLLLDKASSQHLRRTKMWTWSQLIEPRIESSIVIIFSWFAILWQPHGFRCGCPSEC